MHSLATPGKYSLETAFATATYIYREPAQHKCYVTERKVDSVLNSVHEDVFRAKLYVRSLQELINCSDMHVVVLFSIEALEHRLFMDKLLVASQEKAHNTHHSESQAT